MLLLQVERWEKSYRYLSLSWPLLINAASAGMKAIWWKDFLQVWCWLYLVLDSTCCHIIARAVRKDIFTSSVCGDLCTRSVIWELIHYLCLLYESISPSYPLAQLQPEHLEYNMCNWPEASQHHHYAVSLASVATDYCSPAGAWKGLEKEWEVDFLSQRCKLIILQTLAHYSSSNLHLALIAKTFFFFKSWLQYHSCLMAFSWLHQWRVVVVKGDRGRSLFSQARGRIVCLSCVSEHGSIFSYFHRLIKRRGPWARTWIKAPCSCYIGTKHQVWKRRDTNDDRF